MIHAPGLFDIIMKSAFIYKAKVIWTSDPYVIIRYWQTPLLVPGVDHFSNAIFLFGLKLIRTIYF